MSGSTKTFVTHDRAESKDSFVLTSPNACKRV